MNLKSIQFASIFLICFLGVFLALACAKAADLITAVFESTPLFDDAQIVPGDTKARWVKVNNISLETQAIAAAVDYYEDPDDLGRQMRMQISSGAEIYYDNLLSDFFRAGEVYLSDINSGIEKQYYFTISFDSGTGNAYQGKSLEFDVSIGAQSRDAQAGALANFTAGSDLNQSNISANSPAKAGGQALSKKGLVPVFKAELSLIADEIKKFAVYFKSLFSRLIN